MSENDPMTNGVKITNRDIYEILVDVRGRVGGVEQTMRQVVEPTLSKHEERLNAIAREKADREMVTEVKGRTSILEMRVYAIIGGLVAALFGAKGLGLL